MPPKPKMAAITAITKKANAQPNMICSSRNVFGISGLGGDHRLPSPRIHIERMKQSQCQDRKNAPLPQPHGSAV
jgi:hypothetical protein